MANLGTTTTPHFFDTGANVDGVLYANASGEFLTTTVGTATQVLTSNGPGVAPTFQNNPGSTAIQTIQGDTGSVSGSTVSLKHINQGGTYRFDGSGTAMTLNFTDVNVNVGIGSSALLSISSGQNNVGYGSGAGASISTGSENTCIGTSSGNNLVGSNFNTFIGYGAGEAAVTQTYNTFLGANSGILANGGGFNTLLGGNTAVNMVGGANNLLAGYFSGNAYTGSESNNILINNVGVLGESNVTRIGTQGSGSLQQNTCYIAGIVGVTVSNTELVTIDSTTGQLGVTPVSGAINYTNVNSTPYVVLSTDYYLSVDTSGGAKTLNFPNAPTAKQVWIVKDRTGNAAANPITITTPGGTVTFDGQTSVVMNSNFQALQLIANSTPKYEIF